MMATDDPERGGPARPIGETASRALSTMRSFPVADRPARTDGLPAIPRLDDEQMNALAQIADAPLPVLEPVDNEHLMQSLAVLDILPRQNADEARGRIMLAAYRRKIGHMPREQIDYLCNAVLEECEWFPPIAKCLKIAARWQRKDAQDRERARNLLRHERQARMQDAHSRLKWSDDVTQEEVDSWPESWREIAATQGLLYRDPERLHQIRPRAIPAPADQPTTKEIDDDGTATD